MTQAFRAILFSVLTVSVCWLLYDRYSGLAPLSSIFEERNAKPSVPASVLLPRVPDMMVFAGDTIRFDRADMHERMEREMIAFSYSHSNSLLMLKRSTRIFPRVAPLLKRYGVPDDLKYLMAIESNLDESAYSRAGAAGLWQFMKSVAREYGLEVSLTVDERYNLERATEAACRYLKKSHGMFGDWMTVAASYNGGINGISRRVERQKQRSALDLVLVEETSRYMFRILTAKLFFEDPARFGFSLDKSDYYPYVPPKITVTVRNSIDDLPEFARRHGLTYAQLHRANPWLRDTRLEAGRGRTYHIDIPDIEEENKLYMHLADNQKK